MATKHTENYQLNLWEPEDKFVRTEFNENSSKIDAALRAHDTQMSTLQKTVDAKTAYTHIRTETLSTAQSQLSVDLSGIDWSRWEEVVIKLALTGTGGIYGWPNGVKTDVSLSNWGNMYPTQEGVCYFSIGSTPSYIVISLFPRRMPQRPFYAWTQFNMTPQVGRSTLTYSQVTSILFGNSTSATFNAGCTAEVWAIG